MEKIEEIESGSKFCSAIFTNFLNLYCHRFVMRNDECSFFNGNFSFKTIFKLSIKNRVVLGKTLEL